MNSVSPIIHLVDDDPSVRRSISRLLQTEGWNVQCYASGRDFLDGSNWQSSHCCLILDVSMPGMSGLELQDFIHDNGDEIPIIFITARGDIPMSVRAMKRGAVDFLAKPFKDHDLFAAIEEAVKHSAQTIQNRVELSRIQKRVDRLTPREHQVMRFVIGGFLNKQIADELKAAEKTIKVHRGRVMKKMEVDSVAKLVRLCDKAGIKPHRRNANIS